MSRRQEPAAGELATSGAIHEAGNADWLTSEYMSRRQGNTWPLQQTWSALVFTLDFTGTFLLYFSLAAFLPILHGYNKLNACV